MKREELTKFKIQKLLEEHDVYDFPIFLSLLRKMHGMKRTVVCEDIGMSITRLFHLENGQFNRLPSDIDFQVLSNYYGVPIQLLKKKTNEFLREKEERKKTKEAHV